MAPDLPARAAERVLTTLGLPCEPLEGAGLLLDGPCAGPVGVFFRRLGGRIPRVLLEELALVALCGAPEGRLDRYRSCPWLNRKVKGWAFSTFLTQALR